MAFRYLVPVTLVIALAGCGSIGAIGLPWKRDRQVVAAAASRCPPTAMAPVQSADLAPLDGTMPSAECRPTALDERAAGAAAGQPDRDDRAGRRRQRARPHRSSRRLDDHSAGDSCQLFMTLTSWTGGYRASTRGCTSDLLKSISAWNLQGSEVILAGQGGTPLARLASSGNNRFDGQRDGQVVSFYR